MNKQNKTKTNIYATDYWLPEVKGLGGVKCVVTDGNWTFGVKCTIVYTDIEL